MAEHLVQIWIRSDENVGKIDWRSIVPEGLNVRSVETGTLPTDIHHEVRWWITRPLTPQEWLELDDAEDQVLRRIVGEGHFFGTAGPLPVDEENTEIAARDRMPEPSADEDLTEQDLDAYRGSSARGQHRVAVSVARTMLTDPDFRSAVEFEMDRMLGKDSYRERLLERAHKMFQIGEDAGRIWCWINGLKTYGEGETWGEARKDTLEEISYALDELWQARQARGGEAGGEDG